MFLDLFPTAISISKYKNHDIDKENLLKTVKEIMDIDPGANRSNVGGWHSSPNENILLYKTFENVKNFICFEIKNYINNCGYSKTNLQLRENWLIVTHPGGFNKEHAHANAFLSGSFYIKNPSSPIVFKDPRETKVFTNPTGRFDNTKYSADVVDINPKEGDLIIFPSWLKHLVPENTSNDDRVILSFNAYSV